MTREISDHFDGKVFFAPEKMRNKSFLDILKWTLTAQRAKWPLRVDTGPTDRPPARVEGGELRVSFVNHSTVLLQTRSLNILTDPVWSMRASPLSFIGPKRVHAPGIMWDDLPKIDIVLISHSHYDHLDMPTVKKLVARDAPMLIVPLGVEAIIRKHVPAAACVVMDWKQSHTYNADLNIHAEAVQHWSARGFGDRNTTLWTGCVLDLPDGKIYYAGDTGYGTGKVFRDTFDRHGPVRFAMIPIGAYEPRWFMKDSHANPEEAVRIFQDIHAGHTMAIHWGTFQLTDEAIDAPVKFLRDTVEKTGISLDRFRALRPGEAWIIP